MRNKINILGAILLFLILANSCVDDTIQLLNVEKPASIEQLEYLNDYDELKTYIDRSAYPNFKLGAGVTVSDYIKQGLTYRVINSNFDRVTAGNAMKYGSVVKDDGSMDFGQVVQFVNVAKAAGIEIYGHTLLWHAQQNNKYLNKIIADKEIEVDPDATLDVEDKVTDFSTMTEFPFYVMGYKPDIVDGVLVSNFPGEWYQYFVVDGISTDPSKEYKVTAMIRSSKEGSFNVQMGNWGATFEKPIRVTTEWEEQSVTFNTLTTESSFVVFQPGTFDGEIQIKWVRVSHSEAPSISWWTSVINNGDLEGDDLSNFFATEKTDGPKTATLGAPGTGADGVGRAIVVQSGDNPTNPWDTQFFVKANRYFEEGDRMRFSMKYRAEKEAGSESQAHKEPGGYLHYEMVGSPVFTPEWKEHVWVGTVNANQAGMNTIAFNLAVLGEANTYYFDDITWEIEEAGNKIPLTPEEKADTLTWALDQWIEGMMTATDGYVLAWDLANEVVSGADTDGDGIYDLWSAENVSEEDAKNNFYWRDYLGDDFIRIAVASARKHGPEGLQLFINDYNLESDWDNNQKLESLIKWIERWESDGVTVIDGIGTQMHVSCYMDPEIQARKEAHVVRMFELMAATGKLVAVTELDMGLVDEDGVSVLTSDVTEEQHKAMSDYYKFIVKKYLEIIPPNQQAGITHWCPADSPAESSWRGGEPVGLWTEGFQTRKHTYAGFADGLSGN
jgi:endo-1,4-beta-xylanase